MSLRVITPPAAEPVAVETAKAHLRVDGSEEDALIASYIKAAREKGEAVSRRAFMTQTLESIHDVWPQGLLKLPRSPLQAVLSVKYLDEEGDEHSWTNYQVDARQQPGTIRFNSLPAESLYPSGAIAIRFTAGYGNEASAVPEVIKQAILTAVAYWFETRDTVDLPTSARNQFLSQRATWF